MKLMLSWLDLITIEYCLVNRIVSDINWIYTYIYYWILNFCITFNRIKKFFLVCINKNWLQVKTVDNNKDNVDDYAKTIDVFKLRSWQAEARLVAAHSIVRHCSVILVVLMASLQYLTTLVGPKLSPSTVLWCCLLYMYVNCIINFHILTPQITINRFTFILMTKYHWEIPWWQIN